MRFLATARSRRLRVALLLVALGGLSVAGAGCIEASADSRARDQGVFDNSMVHEITLTFAQEDYDAMIQTFLTTRDKEWITAVVTIDGETYEDVGLRLKGNSSIMGLARTGAAEAALPGAAGQTVGDGAAGAARGGPGGDASVDAPEGLPWLIDLDRTVDNQNHEGVVELAVRSNVTDTALNEAVSLDLLTAAGLASQDAAYAGFSVNGSEPELRLVTENPDDLWMADTFDIRGALYKAESTGDYSYRGDDPASYDQVFDQEAGKTNADLTPLMEFLDFLNNADDATFKAELPECLDVDAFATYLAMEELLVNEDDIDGMGNNSYLYYDTSSEVFTVVPWDHNLAFGAMNAMGGAGVRPGVIDGDTPWGDGGTPRGGQPPSAAQRPDGALVPAGARPQDETRLQDGARGGAGMGGRSNILVQRFMADDEWSQLYQARVAELGATLYESGAASEILQRWVTLLQTQASTLVEPAIVDEEAATIAGFFTR